jgi:hypothetical protein
MFPFPIFIMHSKWTSKFLFPPTEASVVQILWFGSDTQRGEERRGEEIIMWRIGKGKGS